MWIDHPAAPMPGHKFMGWYFMYPSEAQHLGLVSTVSDDPPALGWIFVDKDSHLVRHGSRGETLGGHTIGPWHWSNDEQWLTLEGDDANFVAVQLENKKWVVAWDGDGRIRSSGGTDETEESDESEDEVDAEDKGEEGEGGDLKRPRRPLQWLPIKLRRRMQLGMESRYVKGEKG